MGTDWSCSAAFRNGTVLNISLNGSNNGRLRYVIHDRAKYARENKPCKLDANRISYIQIHC